MAVSKLIYNGETKFDLTSDTVTAADLRAGVTAHDKSGGLVTGINTADSDTSDANAAAAELLSGRTAYARGAKLTGTMPNNGAVSGSISDAQTPFQIVTGFHDGGGRVGIAQTEKAKLIPGNIKSGVSILGVTGSYGGDAQPAQSRSVTPSFAEQTVLPDSGYVLSQVTVAAIPVTETPNSAGGVTVTIG